LVGTAQDRSNEDATYDHDPDATGAAKTTSTAADEPGRAGFEMVGGCALGPGNDELKRRTAK
jgi:hypothetical protein